MERNSCIFYKSFYDSIKELDPQDQVQIYNAIFSYQFDNIEIDLKGVCKSIFTLIIPQLEANNKRYENGTKGGRPKTKIKPNENQKETKDKPNDNVNENDNVNNNDNIIKNNISNDTLKEIIEYLNSKTNKSYRLNTKDTRKHIEARLKEGFTIDDFKKVIDNKTNKWLNTEMEQYLRPTTLFGTKFESYLNEKNIPKKEQNIPDLPNWFNQEYKEKERTDEQERQLQELIRGNQR